jgi:hypothetical protein
MSGSYVFSEKGRARRAGKEVYLLFFIVSLLLAFGGGYALFNYYTFNNLSPLQRVYYYQFRDSFARRFNSFSKTANYALFTRVVTDPKTKKEDIFICPEIEMSPKLNDAGKVVFSKDGIPQFLLKGDVPVDKGKFIFGKRELNNEFAYNFFKTKIYDSGYEEFLYIPAIFGLFVFGFSFFGMELFRNKNLAKKLEGDFLRGTRLLSPKEYCREMRNADGIGIVIQPFK